MRIAGKAALVTTLMLVCAASPASAAVLHDQLSPIGANAIPSDDFNPPQDALDATVADDFTVPRGQTWSLTRIDAPGDAPPSLTPATRVVVYRSAGAAPAAEVFSTGATSATTPDYSLTLRSPGFGPGAYWISIQQLGAGFMTPSWAWYTRAAPIGERAVFRNPGNGFGNGCSDWTAIDVCFSIPYQQMAFALNGTAASQAVKLGKLRRRRATGTAVLAVTAPGPGVVAISGKGLRRRRVTISGSSAKARSVDLRIAARGGAAASLERKGRIGARVRILYTAPGATPSTRIRNLTLVQT